MVVFLMLCDYFHNDFQKFSLKVIHFQPNIGLKYLSVFFQGLLTQCDPGPFVYMAVVLDIGGNQIITD